MKTETVEIELLEIGDRVSTPNGDGTVSGSDIVETHRGYFLEQIVTVQLDEGYSNNTGNKPEEWEAQYCIIIRKEIKF